MSLTTSSTIFWYISSPSSHSSLLAESAHCCFLRLEVSLAKNRWIWDFVSHSSRVKSLFPDSSLAFRISCIDCIIWLGPPSSQLSRLCRILLKGIVVLSRRTWRSLLLAFVEPTRSTTEHGFLFLWIVNWLMHLHERNCYQLWEMQIFPPKPTWTPALTTLYITTNIKAGRRKLRRSRSSHKIAKTSHRQEKVYTSASLGSSFLLICHITAKHWRHNSLKRLRAWLENATVQSRNEVWPRTCCK